jgi:hypothetical protein
LSKRSGYRWLGFYPWSWVTDFSVGFKKHRRAQKGRAIVAAKLKRGKARIAASVVPFRWYSDGAPAGDFLPALDPQE